jgi:hypothetical protein
MQSPHGSAQAFTVRIIRTTIGRFQTSIREFFETVVRPESERCEESGKRISQAGCRQDGVCHTMILYNKFVYCSFSETNIIAMRLGPGKHLQGRTLLGGIVEPYSFDYFYEVCLMSVRYRSFPDTS